MNERPRRDAARQLTPDFVLAGAFAIAQQPSFVQHRFVDGRVDRSGPTLFILGFVMCFRGVAAVAVFLSLLSPASALQFASGSPEAKLATLDAIQKDMVAKADVDGLAALSAPDLKINAPTNRILSHDQFLAMMRSGQIGAEAFERTVENISIHGDLGIVMGNEVFTPTAGSELGKIYGTRPLKRRYTNIYVLDQGQWKWLVRHANVVLEASSTTR